MASVAGLSLAANTFAPVGLADVAFRAGTELCRTLIQLRGATSDADTILKDVQRLEMAIAHARAYLQEFAKSGYADDDQKSISDIIAVLDASKTEFDNVRVSAETLLKTTKNEGWLFGWMGRARFVLDAKSRLRAHTNLEQYATCLGTMLVSLGGQCQTKMRVQLNEVDMILKSSASHARNMDLSTAKCLQDIKTCLQDTVSKAEVMDRIQIEAIQGLQAQIKALVTTTAMNGNQDFDMLPDGTDLHTILEPLMSIRADLSKAIDDLSRNGMLKMSQQELDWLESEFESLVDAACSSRLQARTRPGIPCSQVLLQQQQYHNVSCNNPSAGCNRYISLDSQPEERMLHGSYTLETPSGILTVRYSRFIDHSQASGSSYLVVYFSLQPRNGRSVGIDAVLCNKGHTQTRARSFKVLSADSDILQMVKGNAFNKLGQLLNHRAVLPFYRNVKGETMMEVAIRHGSLDTADLFLRNRGGNDFIKSCMPEHMFLDLDPSMAHAEILDEIGKAIDGAGASVQHGSMTWDVSASGKSWQLDR